MFRMKKAASSFGRERLHLSCSFWDLVYIVGLVVMPVWKVIAALGRAGAAEEEEEVAYLLLTSKVGGTACSFGRFGEVFGTKLG